MFQRRKSGWKKAEPRSKMEEVRSWKWEEMVGPAARLEENMREELKPQSLVSGQSNHQGATS